MSATITNQGMVLESWGKTIDHRTGMDSGWVTAKGSGGEPTPPGTYPGQMGGMVLDREEIRHETGSWTYTKWYSSVAAGAKPEYQLDVSLANESITLHPKFKEFATPANGAQFDPETGEFKGFFKYPVSGAMENEAWIGVTDFLAPGVVWRSITRGGSSAGLLTGIGKVGTPEGPCPAAPGSSTWLYMGGSMSTQGGVTTVRKEWRLSGPRGWNTTIYGA